MPDQNPAWPVHQGEALALSYAALLRQKQLAADLDHYVEAAQTLDWETAALDQWIAQRLQAGCGRKKRQVFYQHLRRGSLALACLLALLFVTATVLVAASPSVRQTVLGIMIQWDDETLRVERRPGNCPAQLAGGPMAFPSDSGQEYASLADALAENQVAAAYAITWIPEDFALREIEAQRHDFSAFFLAVYSAGDGRELILSINHTPDLNVTTTVEKDPGGSVYIRGDMTFYLTTNMGRPTASWLDRDNFYLLFGDVTQGEMLQMVDSVPVSP